MTTSQSRSTQSRGMCRGCGHVGTRASMTTHQATCPVRQAHGQASHEVFRLRVSGGGPYWLDVDASASASLDDLDAFLRGIWLECCGHLSEFTIGPRPDYDRDPFAGPKRGKQRSLDVLGLHEGQTFGYTYDMGSSTELDIRVQAREAVHDFGDRVRLLARNLPPTSTCSQCSAPAKWVHSWEYDEDSGLQVMYCGRHGRSTRDEQLPLVNSPRTGVCGYEGGNLDEWPPVAKEPKGEAESASRPAPKPAKKAASKKKASTIQPVRIGGLGDRDLMGSVQAMLAQMMPDDEDLLAEAQALPLVPESAWLLATLPLPGLLPPGEGLPVAALVLDVVSGRIVMNEVLPEPTPDDLLDTALLAMLEPLDGTAPQRPGRLFAVDAALAFSLHTGLAALDIVVERQDFPRLPGLLDELRGQIYSQLPPAEARTPQPFLSGALDEDVRDLVAAFGRWLAARPWQVFTSSKPVRASWTNPDGTPGQLYGVIMGDLGEVYGLALYPTWLDLARHLNNGFDPELMMRATGGVESLTRSVGDETHPDDWARLLAAGLPAEAGVGPALQRFGPQGLETPHTPLRPLIAVLNVMAGRAESRRSNVTSLTGEQDGVAVRFPVGPRDELRAEDRAGSVELRIQKASPYGFNGEIVLLAPPDALLRQTFSQARGLLDADHQRISLPYHLELSEGELAETDLYGPQRVRIWDSRPEAPNLTVQHLVGLGPLSDGMSSVLEAVRLPDTVQELSAEARPQGKPAKSRSAGGKSAQARPAKAKSAKTKSAGRRTWLPAKR